MSFLLFYYYIIYLLFIHYAREKELVMDIGATYINRITELYQVDASIKASMVEHIDVITKQLGKWSWEDIEQAIDWYYTKKNDIKFPKVAQIRAILNSKTKDKPSNLTRDKRNDDYGYNLPYTNIKVISDAFLTVCRFAHENGILNIPYFEETEGLKHGNDTYLRYKDEEKKKPYIWKKRWDWDDSVEKAKERFPDTFGKFKNMTKPEEYTLAYKLGIIRLGE